ncbi:MAG: tetratricopeptide (TPR) repeat protein [Vicingaceae bacterium]|jgi:tetratricopeptide (TPR) repeat protein
MSLLEYMKPFSKSRIWQLQRDYFENAGIEAWQNGEVPQLTTHGSFSLTVNYHALKWYCENEKGMSLFPRYQHTSLDLGCLLLLNDSASYSETINACDKHVQDFGPDDYFNLKKLVEKNFGSLSYRDIVAVTRLSGYDAGIFQQMLPDLLAQIETISNNERWNLMLLIPRIWDTYFPLGEADDLPTKLGNLLFELKFYKEAIIYFEKSIVIYGKTEHVLYNIALCYCLFDNIDATRPIITELMELNPDNKSLKELIEIFGINEMKEKSL